MAIFSLWEVKQPRSLLIHWTGAFGGVGTITRTGNVMFFMYSTQYANQLCKVNMGLLTPLVTISWDVLTYRLIVSVVRDLGWWFQEKKVLIYPFHSVSSYYYPQLHRICQHICAIFNLFFGTFLLFAGSIRLRHGHAPVWLPFKCIWARYRPNNDIVQRFKARS